MSIESDYMARTCQIVRESWFPEHVAVQSIFENSGKHPMRFLQWQKNGTSNYLVRYFLHMGTLMVNGDLGSATYRWSFEPGITDTFEWIAKCDFHYFASKLEGLNGAGEGRTWDPRILEKRGFEVLTYQPGLSNYPASLRDEWRDNINDRDDWNRWIWDNIEKIGYDRAASLAEMGFVPNPRVIGHWMGLRMAFGKDKP